MNPAYDESRPESTRAHRTALKESDTIDERDRELLLKFGKRIRRQQQSTASVRRLLRDCANLAGVSEKYDAEELPDVALADALEDRDAAEELVDWINRHYENEESNKNFRIALRVFGGRMTDGPLDEKPESIEWISSSTSSSYDPGPDPAEMLHWEGDILPMIEETMNPRDAALIAVAWDSGARSRTSGSSGPTDVATGIRCVLHSDHIYSLPRNNNLLPWASSMGS